LWRRLSFGSARTDQPFLNRRADALVGRIFTLERPIVDGAGTVRVDDSVWRITGRDLPAGRRVKVVGVQGTALHVELVTDP
jgi:inner membrane protein